MASSNIQNVIKLMVFEGLNQNEATRKVNITPQYFSTWKTKNETEYDELKVKYEREALGNLSSLAIQTYKDILLKGRSEHVKYLISQDILDRTGHKATDSHQIEHIGQVNFIDDID